MNTIKLKNGAEEPEPLVVMTVYSLERLLDSKPIAFYELTQFCRNPNHTLWGSTKPLLETLGLVQDGQVHDSVRNVVLSAVVGDDLDMSLESPVAK